MSVKEFDVVVIGAGATGQSVATAAAEAGKTVAMTEGRAYGGTCPLRGCDPKLVLHAAAQAMHRVDRLRGKAFTSHPGFSWPELMAWKRTFTEPVPEKARKKMQDHGIEVYSEYATFVDAHTLDFGDTRVKGKTIVIAAGMKPAPLDIPGNEYLLTSDDFLEMEDLPAAMIIVGGGYIGAETAHVCQALGCKVTMIVSESVPLDKFDHRLSEILMEADKEYGMKFELNSKAVAVRKNGNRFEVDVENEAGDTTTLTTDRVIHCAGRIPNLKELKLEAAGIIYDESKGIEVDDHLRTNLAHVYAIGDCADSGLPLTPVGSYEAGILNGNLFKGKDRATDYYPIPTVAFTLPAITAVGMTQKEADEAMEEGRKIKTYSQEAPTWYYPHHFNSPVMAYKIFVDEDEDRILGAHILGAEAGEAINLFYLAIKQQMGVDAYKEMLYTYPTLSASTKSMLG